MVVIIYHIVDKLAVHGMGQVSLDFGGNAYDYHKGLLKMRIKTVSQGVKYLQFTCMSQYIHFAC